MWDYYRNIHEYAMNLDLVIIRINVLTGEQSKDRYIPAGLRDELVSTLDEIELWQKYEKAGEMK